VHVRPLRQPMDAPGENSPAAPTRQPAGNPNPATRDPGHRVNPALPLTTKPPMGASLCWTGVPDDRGPGHPVDDGRGWWRGRTGCRWRSSWRRCGRRRLARSRCWTGSMTGSRC
jgi:hypothetical protein